MKFFSLTIIILKNKKQLNILVSNKISYGEKNYNTLLVTSIMTIKLSFKYNSS